jgi:hypothetical protein
MPFAGRDVRVTHRCPLQQPGESSARKSSGATATVLPECHARRYSMTSLMCRASRVSCWRRSASSPTLMCVAKHHISSGVSLRDACQPGCNAVASPATNSRILAEAVTGRPRRAFHGIPPMLTMAFHEGAHRSAAIDRFACMRGVQAPAAEPWRRFVYLHRRSRHGCDASPPQRASII